MPGALPHTKASRSFAFASFGVAVICLIARAEALDKHKGVLDSNRLSAIARLRLQKLDVNSPASGGKPKIHDDGELDVYARQWAAQHPEEAGTGNIVWSIGLLLITLGVSVMLYSEISAVLLYRELDDALAADIHSEGLSVDLRRRQLLWGNGMAAQYRPTMTVGGGIVTLISFTAMFYSQCPMLDKISSEYDIQDTSYSGNCTWLSLRQAVLTGSGLICFLVGLVWSCTRFFPALLLLLLSVCADIAASYPGPEPVILWLLTAAAAAALYTWLKSLDDPPPPSYPSPSGSPGSPRALSAAGSGRSTGRAVHRDFV